MKQYTCTSCENKFGSNAGFDKKGRCFMCQGDEQSDKEVEKIKANKLKNGHAPLGVIYSDPIPKKTKSKKPKMIRQIHISKIRKKLVVVYKKKETKLYKSFKFKKYLEECRLYEERYAKVL